MGDCEPLARSVVWPKKDCADVRLLRAINGAPRKPRVCARVRLRRQRARRCSRGVSSVDLCWPKLVRPTSASPRVRRSPLPEPGREQGKWSPAQGVCQKCGKQICGHILDAAVLAMPHVSADHAQAESPLRMWFAEGHCCPSTSAGFPPQKANMYVHPEVPTGILFQP